MKHRAHRAHDDTGTAAGQGSSDDSRGHIGKLVAADLLLMILGPARVIVL